MRAGEFADGEKTLRAKIDLASPNMNMRDPAIYRIKHVTHHRQGDKWCIYPLYDFCTSHPGRHRGDHPTRFAAWSSRITARCMSGSSPTLWGGEFPKQREFARLNMTNTVMSKRYLRELVEKGHRGRLGRPPACPPCPACAAAATPLPASSPLCSRQASPRPTAWWTCVRWRL